MPRTERQRPVSFWRRHWNFELRQWLYGVWVAEPRRQRCPTKNCRHWFVPGNGWRKDIYWETTSSDWGPRLFVVKWRSILRSRLGKRSLRDWNKQQRWLFVPGPPPEGSRRNFFGRLWSSCRLKHPLLDHVLERPRLMPSLRWKWLALRTTRRTGLK